ncbi:hypothetical protein LTR86_004252 [Recurvomyces mirabilis]|nr:hypothetical protein LTR86_004252 [Recurvomyces mirabilis]
MGSKTSRGGVSQARTKPTPSREQQEKRPNSTKLADETVEVYSDGSLVGTVSRKVLLRFSKVASVAFPKPAGKENEMKTSEKSTDAEPTLWSTAYVKKATNGKETTKVRLVLENVQRQPSEEALRQVLRWMDINKDVHGNEEFLPFFTDTAADLPLSVLLDLYGATLAFHLRPAPHALREHLSKVILHEKPSTSNIEIVHTRVPTNEGLHKWMITAYYRWCEDGDLSDHEIQVIQEFIYKNADLTNLFLDVEEARKQRKEQQKERNAAKTKARAKAAKDLQDGWKAMADGGLTADFSKGPSVAATGNGKGVDGKHVPGA